MHEFLAGIRAEAPPLAVLERITADQIAPTSGAGFGIVASPAGGAANTLVSADSASCADCLREMGDPADRRFRYPFVNCTNCGPRFTIVRGVPYDRPLTTMAGFPCASTAPANTRIPRTAASTRSRCAAPTGYGRWRRALP